MTVKTWIPALALAAALLMAFAASPARPMIKEMRQLKGADSLTGKGVTKFFYDKDSRVTRVENSNGVTSVYEYKPTVIYRRTTDQRTKKAFTDTFLLNDKGLVTQHRMGYAAPERSTNLREYDSTGLLLKERSVNRTPMQSITTYTNRDGNPVSTTQQLTGDSWMGRSFYTYYTTGSNTIGNENMGMGFEGRNPRGLVQSHIQVWRPGDTSRTYQRYHFDAQGRVSVRATYYQGKLGDSTAYSYY
ncbi:MAG: hypothetical protein JSS76_18005 [Bacteroidetes bacterium]|nr:hypothetical protein [Bacteroidota bacterium]